VTAVKRYVPSTSVTAVRVPICCGLVIVTVTPGITASDASVTLPLIAPVPEVTAWAKVRDEERRSKHKASGSERLMGTLQEKG
jgi:hypothetical protein